MKKSILRIAVLGLLAAAVAVGPTHSIAQEKKEKTVEGQEGKKGKRGDGLPLGGKVAAIDKAAKTIKVGETTVQVNDETRFRKAGGVTASLEDVKVGEEVGISYKKDGEKNVALSVRVGPRGEGSGKKKKDQ